MREVKLVIITEQAERIKDLIDYMKKHDMHIENLSIRDVPASEKLLHEIDMRFSTVEANHTLSLYNRLRELPFVKNIKIEYLD